MSRIAAIALCAAVLAQAGTRERFLALIDRPRVPLAPTVEERGPGKFHFTFESAQSRRVPGILIKDENRRGRLPVIVVLHGTGGSKDGFIALLKRYADAGFLAVAIDGPYHGERAAPGARSKEYVAAITRAWHGEAIHPFLYDAVWDVMRLIDYLQTRDDVDPARIGLIGFSKGGMETYLTAAVDPRVKVAVPCIGVQSFRYALDHDIWQSRVGTFQGAVDTAAADEHLPAPNSALIRKFYDRVAPGVYGDFDGPNMLPLIAPRALLTINGDSDARTPLPGLMECIEAARKAYAATPEKFRYIIQKNTAHKVNPDSHDEALAWFTRWLKP